jgi:ferric-dicitrate binding protein FerR (iron transport regulator)
VASITGLVYIAGRKTPDKQVASNTTVLTDTLPDGSQITLNRQSTISYPVKFHKDRSIHLKGEAFFKIAADKENPFRVYTNGITITVLGTSFNVRSKGTATEIIVESGLVRVTDSLHSIVVHPSEKVVIHQGDPSLSTDQERSELYKYYRTKEFVCDNTPLWQLAESLEQAYDVHITITDPALRELKINTIFRNESLDQILSVIQETFRIKIRRTGNQVII